MYSAFSEAHMCRQITFKPSTSLKSDIGGRTSKGLCEISRTVIGSPRAMRFRMNLEIGLVEAGEDEAGSG